MLLDTRLPPFGPKAALMALVAKAAGLQVIWIVRHEKAMVRLLSVVSVGGDGGCLCLGCLLQTKPVSGFPIELEGVVRLSDTEP